MNATIHVGDCRDVLAAMPDASVHAVVCDPPYELSDDGKASPNRVFLELMFPEYPKVEALGSGDSLLNFLALKIADLSRSSGVPSPPPAVPVGAVAFHDEPTRRDQQIKHASESPVIQPDRDLCVDVESETPEHLGCFALELTDVTSMLNALNCAGSGFQSGGLGIGFGVQPPADPSFSHGLASVVFGNHDVRPAYDALADLIGAPTGATGRAVLRLDLGWDAEETLSAYSATILLTILKAGSAKLVRTTAPTGRLASKLQARRFCVVSDPTRRTLTFDLIVHPQSISSTGFMGKSWDGQKLAFDAKLWAEIYRVLRPGGHLVAFGGTRTHHRLVCAIEDAGFEIRDCLAYMFGSGFPKSLDVSKAIDKTHGLERPIVSTEKRPDKRSGNYHGASEQRDPIDWNRTSAASAASAAWDGWGTALKPAYEPICLARKPLSESSVAKNVLRWGTGAINVGACRIEAGDASRSCAKTGRIGYAQDEWTRSAGGEPRHYAGLGRWPANLLLDEEAAAMLDDQAGERTSGKPCGLRGATTGKGLGYGSTSTADTALTGYGDTGGASRFFFTAKPSVSERESGLAHVKPRTRNRVNSGGLENDPRWAPTTRRNTHPTVKPFSLMSWLVRLVTPPGGIVLDPFLGSGSTGMAAVAEGFDFIGIEQDAGFAEIAEGRIRNIAPLLVTVALTTARADAQSAATPSEAIK